MCCTLFLSSSLLLAFAKQHCSFKPRVLPLVLLPVAAIATDPKNWFGSFAYATAMLSLSILTKLWFLFATRQEAAPEPVHPLRPPDAQILSLDRVSQINIDLIRSGPASHCHTELSGPALTLSGESNTADARRGSMEEDGMSTLAKQNTPQLYLLIKSRRCDSVAG